MVSDAANAGAEAPKSKLDEFIERERAKLGPDGHPTAPPPATTDVRAKRARGPKLATATAPTGEGEKGMRLPIPAEVKEALKVMIRSINPKHKITEVDVAKANDALEGVMMYWVDVRFTGDAKYMPEAGLGIGVVGMVVTEVRAQRDPLIVRARAERAAKEAADLEAAMKKGGA